MAYQSISNYAPPTLLSGDALLHVPLLYPHRPRIQLLIHFPSMGLEASRSERQLPYIRPDLQRLVRVCVSQDDMRQVILYLL